MKNLVKTKLIIISLLFSVLFVNAQNNSQTIAKRIYTTTSIANTEPPIIDGLLDDPVWDKVAWAGDFIQHIPNEGEAPSEQTKFKIVYDAENLYLAIRLYDSEPDKIMKRMVRKDSKVGDRLSLTIDSYHDLRTGFNFTVSAAGVRSDGIFSYGSGDSNWNPIWYTKTNIDNEGWTAEIKIPFTQLRFGNDKEQIWGIQLYRTLIKNEEGSMWQFTPRNNMTSWVAEIGKLHGLKNLKPQKQREIQPYTVASLNTFKAEEGNVFRDGSNEKITFGLDGKIGVTNDLTLDFTINPDFGQVEADPASIRLDGFQTFFRDQRPFFVENNNIFNYNLSPSLSGNTFNSDNIFHSRRIGRSPQGRANTSAGEFSDQSLNTTILGAAKFSGKTKNGWSIGILESITDKEEVTIDNNGVRRKEVIEPQTNYFVGRLQKDFNDNNSSIGGIFTATNRKTEANLDFLHKSAYVGGLDFKHYWKNRSWLLSGKIILSQIKGSTEAISRTQSSIRHLFQRIDANYLELDTNRTSLTGTGGNLQLGKTGRFSFEGGLSWRSPELEFNDLGFQQQADDIRHNYWMSYRFLKPFSIFRNLQFNYKHWLAWDFGGNHNLLQNNIGFFATFKNNWTAGSDSTFSPVWFSNSELRGGSQLKITGQRNLSLWFNTDDRKKIRIRPYTSFGRADGSKFISTRLELSFKPTDALVVSLSPSFNKVNNKLQYVKNVSFGDETRYLRGTVDQQTLSAGFRVNYTFTPDLTLQYYAEPFISRGRYSNFKYITNPIASNFEGRYNAFQDSAISFNDGTYNVDENGDGNTDYSFGNPDFAFVQFRSNLVLRWEYIPGSELFLVWSQTQGKSGFANPSDTLFEGFETGILDQQIENFFLIKATYRFSL